MSTKIQLAGGTKEVRNAAFKAIKERLSALDWQVADGDMQYDDVPDGEKRLCILDFDEGEKAPARESERSLFAGVFVLVDETGASAVGRPAVREWVGHQHLRVVDISAGFEPLIAELFALLGIPAPREIERKFLIKRPDRALLDSLDECCAVELSQTYLLLPDGSNARVRRRGSKGDFSYIKTVKTRLSDRVRVETEEPLTESEYKRLLAFADPIRRTVNKTRYCIVWDNRYFELDLFPFWDRQAFVELELTDENEQFSLPPFLEVIREVTDDPRYSNSALAMSIPKQE